MIMLNVYVGFDGSWYIFEWYAIVCMCFVYDEFAFGGNRCMLLCMYIVYVYMCLNYVMYAEFDVCLEKMMT